MNDMGANNWEICPRCRDRAHRARECEMTRISHLYGKVPMDEYERARAAVPPVPKLEPTFREDYEFVGAGTGVLKIVYVGECTLCGLAVRVKEERPFYRPGEA